MISSESRFLKYAGLIKAHEPFRTTSGLVGTHIAYPIAERLEKRNIRPKVAELRKYFSLAPEKRRSIAIRRLVNVLNFAEENVPYYRDLFAVNKIDCGKIERDVQYLQDIPFLTKDIIREHGPRLLSKPLDSVKHFACKTGGSTGMACTIYYDQPAADYSSAVTLYAREKTGKRRHYPELHFACRFPDSAPYPWPSTEDFKCFAMNRSNIFFDRLDDEGLEEIWQQLRWRRPYMVHGHPSTIYALACYVKQKHNGEKTFEIFESSGELLTPLVRAKISENLRCKVINRYGLAELGVMAYDLQGPDKELEVLTSEGWPEDLPVGDDSQSSELVFTGFRNLLMPLIRYRTGDLAYVQETQNGTFLRDVTGRIHDIVPINGIDHATHYVQDVLDHRVGGIQEFQIDLRSLPPILRIVPECSAQIDNISKKIEGYWSGAFSIQFVAPDGLVRVGRHAKFRRVVTN